jgi:hypothetical protein
MGCAYVTGYTHSEDFPTTGNGNDLGYNGDADGFLIKVNVLGSDSPYATYLGGYADDRGLAVTVDGSECAYVAGFTSSNDFPAILGPGYDTSFNGDGGCDAFVVKLAMGEATFSVSGRVTDYRNSPIHGVTVSAGAGHVATTGANGSYTLTQLAAGTYSVAPSKDGYSFSPTLRRVAVPPNKTGVDFRGSNVIIDVSVSFTRTVAAEHRGAYEEILGHFADAVYEMSNGVHRIGRVSLYQDGEHAEDAHVLWRMNQWPCANPAGYGQAGMYVWMGDVFPFDDPFDALASGNRRASGYTLAHEWDSVADTADKEIKPADGR